jgi:hypothetical protein
MGDRHDMAETSAFLAPFDEAMANVYAQRTGQKAADVSAMMDAETWLNGQKAIDLGFADGLLQPDDMQEDPAVTESAAAANALRQAELGLCKNMSRSSARALINKIKGTPGAAPEPATPGAGDVPDWLGQAAELSQALRS